MVGNPLIADVAVQSGGLVVVTGKGYGSTNLIALDRDRRRADGAQDRGARPERAAPCRSIAACERETYSCTPDCERRITLGDSPTYFTGDAGPVRYAQRLGAGRRSGCEAGVALKPDLWRASGPAPHG